MQLKIQAKTMFIAAGMLGVLLLSGCATTTPKADCLKGMALSVRQSSGDEVKARVEADSGLGVLDIERQRMAQRIEERIAAKKVRNAGGSEKKAYAAEVTL